MRTTRLLAFLLQFGCAHDESIEPAPVRYCRSREVTERDVDNQVDRIRRLVPYCLVDTKPYTAPMIPNEDPRGPEERPAIQYDPLTHIGTVTTRRETYLLHWYGSETKSFADDRAEVFVEGVGQERVLVGRLLYSGITGSAYEKVSGVSFGLELFGSTYVYQGLFSGYLTKGDCFVTPSTATTPARVALCGER